VALACGLAAYPIVVAGSAIFAVVPLAALGLVCALLALFFRVRFAAAALFALATEYMVVEATGHASGLSIVVYAVGLVVFCELVFWVGQLSPSTRADWAVVVRRLLGLGLAGVGAAVLALIALAAGGLRLAGGFQGALIGAAAAAALLALPWLLVRRRGVRGQRSKD
jgi:hypothetical protein